MGNTTNRTRALEALATQFFAQSSPKGGAPLDLNNVESIDLLKDNTVMRRSRQRRDPDEPVYTIEIHFLKNVSIGEIQVPTQTPGPKSPP